MKAILTIFFFWSYLIFGQAIEEQNLIVEAGYGYPAIKPISMSYLIFNNHGGAIEYESKEKKYGPFYLKSEFMVSDKIGVTGAIHYSQFYTYEDRTFEEYDYSTGQFNTKSYYYEERIHHWRIAMGINIHVLRTERADSFIGLRAGTKKYYSKFNTNDPTYNDYFEPFVFPYAFRIHYGVRYFLTDYWALHIELGLGGPIVSFGLTYKVL